MSFRFDPKYSSNGTLRMFRDWRKGSVWQSSPEDKTTLASSDYQQTGHEDGARKLQPVNLSARKFCCDCLHRASSDQDVPGSNTNPRCTSLAAEVQCGACSALNEDYHGVRQRIKAMRFRYSSPHAGAHPFAYSERSHCRRQ
jgi:hypothetical protein